MRAARAPESRPFLRLSMRGYFLIFALGGLLPALLFAALILWWSAETQREITNRQLLSAARSLMQAVDLEMKAAISALETLRHVRALQVGDIEGFMEASRAIHRDHPHWNGIVLTDATGQQLMNLAAQPGQPLPNIAHYEVIKGALSGKASVSELMRGRVLNVHLVGIDVPVYVDGAIKYALGLSIPASHFQALLSQHPIPEGWIMGLVDHKGIIVARSLDPAAGIGTPTASMWQEAAASEGVLSGSGRLQFPVVGAYARSELSGWKAIVSVPKEIFDSIGTGALRALAAGGIVLVVINLILVVAAARRVVRPIERLAAHANDYVAGAPIAQEKSPLVEADVLAASLSEAGKRQREVERALGQSQKMEAVGQFAGGVAHDFNNLLTAMQGNLTFISRHTASEGQKYVGRLEQAIERASSLVHRLLIYSRSRPLHAETFDAGARIEAMRPLILTALRADIELLIETEKRPLFIHADPTQFEMAVLNLVVNSRDAMPKGGTIKIECRASHDEVTIIVRDSGVGMTNEVRARAFEPFYTTKPIGQGTGLGLTTVYGLAKQAGGRVDIASESGRGTEVQMRLPMVAQIASEEVYAITEPAHIAVRGRILLVEDDALVLGASKEMLESEGYTVDAVQRADEAVELIAREQFDLLITDIVLPGGLSGIDLAERMHTDHPSLRILLISGYSPDALKERGLTMRFDLLPKPYTAAEFVAQVRKMLLQSASLAAE